MTRRPARPATLVSELVGAELTGLRPAEVVRLARSGEVRSQRINGVVFVAVEDLDRHAAAQGQTAP